MEVTTKQAAVAAGVSTRSAQRAIMHGSLSPLRTVGRQILLDDLAVQAWQRSRVPGRLWSPHVREAALDLLSGSGTRHVTGTALSRLKAALRGMDAARIAHSAGGLGAWARYRSLGALSGHDVIGPSALETATLDLSDGGSWMRFINVEDLEAFEASEPVVLDADGDLGVVERPSDDRLGCILIEAYLLGDTRTSGAAAARLHEAARGL